MHRTFFRADPAQLAVACQMAPELAGCGADNVEIDADHQMAHRKNSLTADVIAATDSKGEAMAFQSLVIRIEDNIGCRVIRVRVHRVRTVQTLRSWEAKIEDAKISNFGHL